MGPAKCPDCPYDRFVAELASPGMRERWAERVNVQWSWGRDGCAWFHLTLPVIPVAGCEQTQPGH